MYLHCAAAGKSILAYLSTSQLDAIISRRGLKAVTTNTITDQSELADELAEIREQGYAVNRQENIRGLNAVGVSVRTRDDEIVGALSISVSFPRVKGEYLRQELPDLLRGTANELELNITYA